MVALLRRAPSTAGRVVPTAGRVVATRALSLRKVDGDASDSWFAKKEREAGRKRKEMNVSP